MLEPMCFYMYKRGDLKHKVDKIDSRKVQTAKRFFQILQQAKSDKEYCESELKRLKEEKWKRESEERFRNMEK